VKIIAVTAAFDWDRALLERVVARFKFLNGIDTIVLDRGILPNWRPRHWGWTKTLMWDYVPHDADIAVWYDADIVSVAPLGALPEYPFSAVRDFEPTIKRVQKSFLPLSRWDCYFNSGFIVCTRESLDVWRLVRWFGRNVRKTPEQQMPGEQSWLNLSVAMLHGSYFVLDPSWNTLGFGQPGRRPDVETADLSNVKMAHFAGTGNRVELMSRLLHRIE
jgi:hypothetical protein